MGRSQLRVWYDRLSPSQGWATFLLLIATLMIVGRSVTAANWVETPGLMALLFGAAVTGLLLAKIRAPALVLLPAGVGIGLLVVIWQGSSLIEEQGLSQQVSELWSRLKAWYTEAASDGFTTDLLPVTFALLALAWLMAYAGSWFVFRRNNVWVAIVLGGMAILTNLSFVSGRLSYWLFAFLFFALLLVARMEVVRNQKMWLESKIEFSKHSGWLTVHAAAVWLSVVVVLLTAFLPMKTIVSYELASVWGVLRTPAERLEDLFARLTAAIPCRKDIGGCGFEDSLPFIGKVSSGGGDIVFRASTDYPSYWLSRTYSEYTSRGWVAGEKMTVNLGSGTIAPLRPDSKRAPVNQSLWTTFETSHLFFGGRVQSADREIVAEILAPKEFVIDLAEPSSDKGLPEDIGQIAKVLREESQRRAGNGDGQLISDVPNLLPSDLELTGLGAANAAAGEPAQNTVTLRRKLPVIPEVVSWTSESRLRADEGYSLVSLISVASDEELKDAGTEYSSFITDHYLQLPVDLPQRVRDLAGRLTADAPRQGAGHTRLPAGARYRVLIGHRGTANGRRWCRPFPVRNQEGLQLVLWLGHGGPTPSRWSPYSYGRGVRSRRVRS